MAETDPMADVGHLTSQLVISREILGGSHGCIRGKAQHIGACFCGAVQIEAVGEPVAMGYCHCASCRSWSASPVHCSTIWAETDVRVTHGAEHLATFHKAPESISHRQFCSKCGGHLMIAHPTLGFFDVMAANLPSLEFEPSVHTNYAESVLPIKDGLPKYRDFPVEFGGSGEMMSE